MAENCLTRDRQHHDTFEINDAKHLNILTIYQRYTIIERNKTN